MKKRIWSTMLALCLLFLLLPAGAAAAGTSASEIARDYQNALSSAALYRYVNSPVAFRDLNGDTLPEMFLWTENKSNPSLTDIQVWSCLNGSVKNAGTITWGMASSGYSLYVSDRGQLVSYGSTSSDSFVWIYRDVYAFSSECGLEQIEKVKFTREYDMALHAFGKLTCEVNGVALSEQEANVRYRALGSDISAVLFGESHDAPVLGMSKSKAQAYLNINDFFDVPADKYYAAPVAWAVENGVTNGTGTYSFSPEQTCTRAQILTFLWRAAGSPTAIVSNPFSDVKPGNYYYQAALWASQNGMVSGSVFAPSTPCTRAATVTYIWQSKGCPRAGTATFSDVPSGAAYAQAVAWAVSNGITDGVGNNRFAPDRTCTRGQIVTFLYRARNIQPSAANSADSWYEAYQEFLFTGAFLRHGQAYSSETPYDVSLYDMDRDGIPELKIDNGAFGRSSRWAYLYSYLNGEIKYLGIGPTDAFIDTNEENGIYGYYRLSPDEINCTLYTKNGVAIETTAVGVFTDFTWPKNLQALSGASVDHIRDIGWDAFVADSGVKADRDGSTQLSLLYNEKKLIVLDWNLSLFGERSDTGDGGSSFHEDLAKAAAYLCAGTYAGKDETEKRMAALGFSDPVSEYYRADARTNTSPITVASCQIVVRGERYLVVAAAVRGTNDLGDFDTDLRSGVFNVDGFAEAGESGMAIVREYCQSRQRQLQIDKQHTVLFTTGHSLGAAIAGQIAGNLEDDVALHEHIFSYTFASPNYETHGRNTSNFMNIHNFVNTEDAVPKFPLGGTRYGQDKTFRGTGKDILDQHMLDTYAAAYLTDIRGGGSGR